MKRLFAFTFTVAAAIGWAQAGQSQGTPPSSPSATPSQQVSPAQGSPQPGAAQLGTTGATTQAAAPSARNSISGCVQRGFATYQIRDAGTGAIYDLHGSGTDVSTFQNKVVQVQGMPDPQARSGSAVVYYVQSMKDTGQSCGPAGQAVAANQPMAGQPGAQATQQTPSTTTAAGQAPAPGTAQQPGITTATGVAPGTPTTGAVTQDTQPGATPSAAGAAATQPSTPAAQQHQVGQTISGTAPAAAETQGQQTAGMESKGTPEASTPQTGAVAAPGGTSASTTGATGGGEVYQGCLEGDANNLKFKANDKEYRLQGNTQQANSLIGHQVEIRGENFNDKAIQVNAVRDLAGSCSTK